MIGDAGTQRLAGVLAQCAALSRFNLRDNEGNGLGYRG